MWKNLDISWQTSFKGKEMGPIMHEYNEET